MLFRSLVDAFGGLSDAVREAASLAGVENYRIVEKPEASDLYTKLLKEMTGTLRAKVISSERGAASRYWHDLKEIMSASGVQAVLPYYIEIY